MKKKVKKLVPQLRFSEFEGDWEKYQLNDLIKIKSGYAFSSNFFSEIETDKILLTPGNFHVDGSLYFGSNTKYYQGEVDEEYILSNGDLLIVMTDLTKEMNILGNSIILQSDKIVLHNQRIGKFLIQDFSLIGIIFLKYILNSDICKLDIRKKATGSTVRHTSNKTILSLVVPIPSIKEQEKIASFLDSVTLRITQLRRKHELLETYKKGVMQKIFSQQIRFKQDNGKPFPDWEKKKLGSIGKFTGGGTPATSNPEYWTGNIPWVSSSDIFEDSVHKISITRFINEKAIKESATKVIPAPSILLVSRVGVGKLAIANKPVCTSQDFSNFTLYKGNITFFAYLLISKKKKLLSISQGTSIKGFTNYDIELLKLEIPVIEEQEKIANFLTSIDKKIEAVELQIEKLEEFKKGLLQKMFV